MPIVHHYCLIVSQFYDIFTLFTRAEGTESLNAVHVFFLFWGCPTFVLAQYGPYYVTVLYTQNGRRLYKQDTIKPWNHLHMCTVLLLTKIVVECMFLWGG